MGAVARSGHARMLTLCGGVLTLLLLGTLLPGTAAGQGFYPSVSLSTLEPQEALAEVSPSIEGGAQMACTVTVNKPPVGEALVQLMVSIDTGWPTSVAPTEMSFNGSGGQQQAVVTVVVPAGALATVPGVVTLTAQMVYLGTASGASSQGQVLVAQYFGMALTGNGSINSGTTLRGELLFTNLGNGLDRYTLERLAPAAGSSVQVRWDEKVLDKVDVGPGQTKKVPFELAVERGSVAAGAQPEIAFSYRSAYGKLLDQDVAKTVTVRWPAASGGGDGAGPGQTPPGGASVLPLPPWLGLAALGAAAAGVMVRRRDRTDG